MNRYTYEKWDKISSVNGLEAQEWLRENHHLREGNVYLIKDNGIIIALQNVEILKRSYNMLDSSDDIIMDEHIKLVKAEQQDRNEYYANAYKEQLAETAQAKLLLMKEGLL